MSLRMSLRPHAPFIRIDTKKSTVEIDRGWPLEGKGHGSPGEVKALLFLVMPALISQMLTLFPRQKHVVIEFLRDAANALEDVHG